MASLYFRQFITFLQCPSIGFERALLGLKKYTTKREIEMTFTSHNLRYSILFSLMFVAGSLFAQPACFTKTFTQEELFYNPDQQTETITAFVEQYPSVKTVSLVVKGRHSALPALYSEIFRCSAGLCIGDKGFGKISIHNLGNNGLRIVNEDSIPLFVDRERKNLIYSLQPTNGDSEFELEPCP